MADPTASAAIRALVIANWAHCDIREINAESDVPEDGSAFAELQFPFATERMMSVGAPGSNLFREEGGARFILYVPRGEGLGSWPMRLKTLRAALRSHVSDDGALRIYEAPPETDASANDHAYRMLSFVFPYEYDFYG